MQSLHSFLRQLHSPAQAPAPTLPETPETKGLILDMGLRHDVMVWTMNLLLFRGQLKDLRRRTLQLADLQAGERALDVGCGTGTLAMDAQRRVGKTGFVAGIDPGARQIAYAQAKATRRNLPIEFRVGVIEQLPYPDQSFDVVFSTLMMHHLPPVTKRQGLAEIARVLKPEGRLVIADFSRKQDRRGRAARFHAGGSDVGALTTFLKDAGFAQAQTEEIQPARFSAFPGAGLLVARRSTAVGDISAATSPETP